jgi:hypothetical protein
MACAVDKIMTHLFHVFLALLCAGGIYLGLWLSKHYFPWHKIKNVEYAVRNME